jgi:hypothetical protein
MVPSEKVSEEIEDIIDSEGSLTEAVTLESEDGGFAVNIPAGTTALDEDGNPVDELILDSPDKIPPPPAGIKNISAVDLGPDGTTFDEPVEITLSYDPGDLPDDVSTEDITISYYDEEKEEWIELTDIVVDTINHTVTGKVRHFTIFAIQIKVPEPTDEPPPEPETPPTEPTAPPPPEVQKAEVDHEPYYLLNSLSLQLQDLLGEKAWAVGYYGESGFSSDGVAFLVEDYSRLLQSRQLSQYTFARLDGILPPVELDGKALMVYGEVKEYGAAHDAFVIFPTPLITVEDYIVFEDFPDFSPDENPWYNFVSASPANNGTTGYLKANYSTGYLYLTDVSASGPSEIIPWPQANEAGAEAATPTQASDCDRVLVICGGVDDNGNKPWYKYQTEQRHKKLKELGFSDNQIDTLQYDGSAINVSGKNIVTGKATMAEIKKVIQKYLDEMPASCTLLVFVDDHGTGYKKGGSWDGQHIALDDGTETGLTYDESSIPVDLRRYAIFRDTTTFTSASGDTWILVKNTATNRWDLYRKQGGSWVYSGTDTNGDGWIKEDEVDTRDIDGDGTPNENYGFELSDFEGDLQAARGSTQPQQWDTDRDGNPDVQARWVNPPGRFYLERKVGNGATGKVGFHEGINLFGNEVLWDYQFAEMLKSLSDKDNGVHVLVSLLTCYAGGLAKNLEGIVDKVCATSVEDKPSWYRPTDAATKASTGLTHLSYYAHGFVKSLDGISISDWNKAHQGAITIDTKRQKEYDGTTTDYPVWEVPNLETKTTYKKHDNGMYSISLRLPQGDKVYDFEIFSGLQNPRWNLSLYEGIGFPEGLPEGMDSELIPGGIRVFSTSPFGTSPLMVRMRAPDGAEITRINFTDADHNTIGYTTPKTEDIPETIPNEASLDVNVIGKIIFDEDTCESTDGIVEIIWRTQNTNQKYPSPISLVRIYVDGKLEVEDTWEKGVPGREGGKNIDSSLQLKLSPGSHVAKLVIRNDYGQEFTQEVEFTVEDPNALIPVSETNKIRLTATPTVSIEGYEPDCTATMTVPWGAEALTTELLLKAAWLRIDGEVVDSSTPSADGIVPEDKYKFPTVFHTHPLGEPGHPGGETDTSLGGTYSLPVQPGSKVLIEVIALGSDCKYYFREWTRRCPSCPSPYVDPPPPLPPCFGADTFILMGDDSTKQISEIQVGDIVKSYDVDSGQVVGRTVVTTNNGQSDYYYIINGNLKVTPPHPFYTLDRDWVPVEELQVGDQIQSESGATTITSVELVLEGQLIYNIGIKEYGNYFVSANGDDFYLVHQGS